MKKYTTYSLMVLLVLAAVACPVQRPTKVVTICTASGQLAGDYCPAETRQERRYYTNPQPGEPVAPTVTCTVHLAPKPKPQPGPPYVGASVYQGLVFGVERYLAFLDKLAEAGGNATELFLVFSWPYDAPTAGWRVSPFLQVGTYTDPASAYGDYPFPKFDLTQRNDATWAALRTIFAHAQELGITVFIRIEDYCSIKSGGEKRSYAYRANVQRFGNSQWYNWEGGYQECARRLVGWLAEALNATGVEYYLIPENESDIIRDPGQTDAQVEALVIKRHEEYLGHFAAHGIPRSRVVINSSRGQAVMRQRWPDLKYEYHGINSPQRMAETYVEVGGPGTSFNGDGPDPYAEGVAGDKPDKRQPSVEQGAEMGRQLVDMGGWALMVFAREVESAAPPDIARCSVIFDVVRAMAAAVWPGK